LFLISLDILGFKSFADKTRIEFADGITALLGPNGCGKSNVVDAIKWVLGEQKSGAMRAEKMEDVIFAGCETRRPLNYAEVALTIANEDGLLPREESQIEIKRRLYRSGESEYYINGEKRILKDIRQLFWDTGVGKAAYSVMEQGKIDQALSSKPEERRYLFEEAAGITKFKAKSREAELKLARTCDNMAQVDGILKEVKRSYDTLKIQAEKTMQYRRLKEEIFNYERDIQLLRLKDFRDRKDERAGTLKKRTAERDACKAELEKLTRSLDDNMELVNSLKNEYNEALKNLVALAKQQEGLAANTRLMNEQRHECKNAISTNESRERTIRSKIEELVAEADEQDLRVRDLKKKVSDIEANIDSFEKNIGLASGQINENEKSISGNEKNIGQLEVRRAELEKELETITDDIVRELDKGLKDAGYSAVQREGTQNAVRAALDKLQTSLSGRSMILRDLTDFAQRGSGTGTEAPRDLAKISAEIDCAIKEALALVEEIKTLFGDYCRNIPVFIDEFLAPEGIITKKRGIDSEIHLSKENVSRKREDINRLRAENTALGAKINEYRQTLQELRVSRAKLNTQAESAEEQAKILRRELAGQEANLKSVQDELFLARRRLDDINTRINDTEQEIAEIEAKGKKLSADTEKIQKDIQRKESDLSGKEGQLSRQHEALSRLQASLEKVHLEIAQNDTEIKNIQDNFRETHSRDLLEFEQRMYELLTPVPELREKLGELKQSLNSLGQVNFTAPDEFIEVKERFEHLSTQMDDLNRAKDDLEKIVAEIRAESSRKFMESYNKIKKNFHNMFRRLFGGGRAELLLTDPNHVLESGIDIFAQPPGKKLENITLLSGGEKSMTAVALLFATYMVKPSPFCLLDEIDAALDEDNVGRFVQLLREFGKSSQFIVITHNKKTIIGCSSAIGVTMAEKGITTMIAIKLRNEDEAARNALDTMEDNFTEEDVSPEEGRELPDGVNDPSQVRPEDLRPLRA